MPATSDQPQLWHRDLPLEVQNVGVERAFSCFMPMNPDCPMDGGENMFVYGSGSGVPYPWQEVSMSMLAGDLWILSSYVIHRGGAVPRDATDFADKWSTLLADIKHVAPADRRFQRTIEAAQFDISTSMWFLTDPKYHVRLVNA